MTASFLFLAPHEKWAHIATKKVSLFPLKKQLLQCALFTLLLFIVINS